MNTQSINPFVSKKGKGVCLLCLDSFSFFRHHHESNTNLHFTDGDRALTYLIHPYSHLMSPFSHSHIDESYLHAIYSMLYSIHGVLISSLLS